MLPPGVATTYDDLVSLFGESTDGKRYELFQGVLTVTPSPSTEHQRISSRIFVALHATVKDARAGEVLFAPVDVLFDANTVCVPDLVFIAAEHADRVTARGIEGAPDLVVEILSPGTAEKDRGAKHATYGEHGVREYWIVDRDARRIERHELREGALQLVETLGTDDVVTTPLVPGFALVVRSVFQ
jgi:Uma2 family endonuclease